MGDDPSLCIYFSLGVAQLRPKTVRKLNNSVLNKMPRDCTAPRIVLSDVQSLLTPGIPYRVTVNIQFNSKMSKTNKTVNKQKPKGKQTNSIRRPGYTTFSHTETIMDVVGGASGVNTAGTFALMASAMPATGSIAMAFQQYRFIKATLHYVPFVADSVSGQICIGFHSDFTDSLMDARAVSNLAGAGSARVSSPVKAKVPVDQQWRNVISPTGLAGIAKPDASDFAAGEVLWALNGVDRANAACGIVRVEYTVEFRNPISASFN